MAAWSHCGGEGLPAPPTLFARKQSDHCLPQSILIAVDPSEKQSDRFGPQNNVVAIYPRPEDCWPKQNTLVASDTTQESNIPRSVHEPEHACPLFSVGGSPPIVPQKQRAAETTNPAAAAASSQASHAAEGTTAQEKGGKKKSKRDGGTQTPDGAASKRARKSKSQEPGRNFPSRGRR